MPNAVYAKKSLRISLWRSMYMLCYSEHCHTSFFNVPKVFPTMLSIKGSKECTHTLQVKQKAPIQHRNFLKTNKQKNEIHRSRKS